MRVCAQPMRTDETPRRTPGSPVGPLLARGGAMQPFQEPAKESGVPGLPLRSVPLAEASSASAAARGGLPRAFFFWETAVPSPLRFSRGREMADTPFMNRAVAIPAARAWPRVAGWQVLSLVVAASAV